jgi:cAMP phosphodiesterase
MKVRVLGCSGAIAKECRTTAFLIDDDVLIDAGTGVGDLSLEEMRLIDRVFLTHSHLDHVAALPLMVDAIAGQRGTPLQIYALSGTINALKTHIFNDVIWPDFTQLPTPDAPLIRFHEIELGQILQCGTKQIEVLPAVHTVPAAGFAVSSQKSCWIFSGDTERNPAFWRRINQLEVNMLVIETAFSRRESQLAQRSLHLSPDVLVSELEQLLPEKKFPIYITHTKPAETEQIMSEIRDIMQLRHPEQRVIPELHWLKAGQEFDL